ncbi:hypothetical protein MMC22_011760 [Lobaria immixta]|nr:hypothetical protein [Lobaria immixta]
MTACLKVTPHRARRWSQNLTKDAPSPPSGDNVDKVEPFSKYSDTSPGKRLLEQPLCQIATYAVVLPGTRLTLGAFALSLSYFTLYGVIVRKYPISKVLIASKRDFCQTTWAPMGNAAAKNAENAVVAADDLINIDPRLWDQHSLDAMQVNDAELTNLQNQLLNPDEPAESKGLDDERDIEALLEEHEDVGQTGVSEEDDASARGFAQKFSRVNVVSRRPFAKAWDSHIKQGMAFDNIGVYAMQGNSRDEPTPMEHKCTKTPGCLYKSLYPNDLAYHEDTCRSDRVTQLAAREQKVLTIACSDVTEIRNTKAMYRARTRHASIPPNGVSPEL